MRTFFLSIIVVVMSVTASYAQNTLKTTDEQKEQMLSSGTCEYGWSEAETAFARMQEAFLNCVSHYIIKYRSTITSLQDGQKQLTKYEGEGYFSAQIVGYKDNGKEAEIEMSFDSNGKHYHYKYVEQDYEIINEFDSKSFYISMIITGEDGVQIRYDHSSSEKGMKTMIASSAEIEFNL